MSRFAILALLVQTLGIVGCSGRPSGDDGDGDGDETFDDPPFPDIASPYCEVTVEDLPTMDAVSPIGLSGEDVVRFAEGMHMAAMRWSPENPLGIEVELNVMNPSSTLTTVVEVTGPARYVDSTKVVPDPANDEIWCFSSVEVDVAVTMDTEDGSLNEEWEATLVQLESDPVDNPDQDTELRFEIPLDELQGQLEVVDISPAGAKLLDDPMDVNITFNSSGFSGEIRLTIDEPDEGPVVVPIGEWE